MALACAVLAQAPARAHEATLLAAADEAAAARASLAAPEPGAPHAALRITLRDSATGAELAGNLRITNAAGKALALAGAQERPEGWHAIATPLEALVPREKLRIEAFQGIETAIAVRELDLSAEAGAHVELALTRFVSATERGLAAGNTHLHLMHWQRARVESYLQAATAADQLDLAWVSYLLRFDSDTPYTTNEFTRAELEALSTPSTRFGWGEELRHNFGAYAIGYGHALLLDLTALVEPVSIGPILAGNAVDAPGLAAGMAEARAQHATVIWAHGKSGYEDLPSWLLGRVDAQNLFDGAEPKARTRGDHANYAEVFYPLLDVGVAAPFSTGTDWFIGDLARVYVPLGAERTTTAFLAQLRAGRSFITNGPLLEFEAGGEAPGGSVRRAAPGVLPLRASAIGRVNFGALEIVAGGRVVASAKASAVDDHFEAEIAQEFAATAPGWLAARIAPGDAVNEFGKPLFAHTSAITVEVAGKGPFRSEVARALTLEMDWNERTIREKGKFADAAQADAVTAPYREARDALSSRMTWRDRLHAWFVRTLRTIKGWFGR